MWIIYVISVLFCYALMHVCLLIPCGHLLGKGWPLGSRLWRVCVTLSLSHWYPGSGVVLDCIDSWSLTSFLLLIAERQNIKKVKTSHWQDTWLRLQDSLRPWMGVIATQKKSGPIDNSIQNTARIGGARHWCSSPRWQTHQRSAQTLPASCQVVHLQELLLPRDHPGMEPPSNISHWCHHHRGVQSRPETCPTGPQAVTLSPCLF